MFVSRSSSNSSARLLPPLVKAARLLVVLALCAPVIANAQTDEISFSRDILPVLSDRCFHCHGPDEGNREADLRLDLEDAAKEDLGGYAAIAPGKLESSEVWQRIITDDPDERMPPADSHRKPLNEAERSAIRRWIKAGAQWGKHWSFEKISRPEVPADAKALVPIDAFVQARLAAKGLQLAERAASHTQLRRLSFDLT